MRTRCLTVAAAVLGLAASTLGVAVPTAEAATCTKPVILGVEADPGKLTIGTRDATVDLYLGVQANGCALTSPRGRLNSPGGGSGVFGMEKVLTDHGVTTYAVRIGISPRDLVIADAGSWQVGGSVTYSGGTISAGGPALRVYRASRVSADATPEPVKKGKTVTVTGTLGWANWETAKFVGYAKQKVTLQFKPTGGTYATVKTVTSAGKGAIRTTVTATKDGCYRYVFGGNASTARSTSAEDCIDVR